MLQLRKGSKKDVCPSCGRRSFTPYVDENGEIFRPEVGFCDHISSCQYHLSPSDFWANHPELKEAYGERARALEIRPTPQRPTPKQIDTIPDDYVVQSVQFGRYSDLMRWVDGLGIFDPLVVEGLIALYGIGSTRDGRTIYFQVDAEGRCRTGKIMRYNETTGHRIKDEGDPNRIDWVHSRLKKSKILSGNWELSQCLFGEHLLSFHPDYPVAVVESEKTAIICAGLMPEYVWVATGGLLVKLDRLSILRGRDVTAFPDSDGVEKWSEALAAYPFIKISDVARRMATPEQIANKCDIADLLVNQLINR